jgi:Putative addiction module component
MSKILPLEEMTLQEKLAAMELLWDDLGRCPESVESPTWHKDILDERHQKVAEAEAHFVDWESAKTEIRKKVL